MSNVYCCSGGVTRNYCGGDGKGRQGRRCVCTYLLVYNRQMSMGKEVGWDCVGHGGSVV